LNSDYCLIVDDTVLEKERSENLPFAKKMYSGNKHKVIKGIGLVNMVISQEDGKYCIPADYRIYDKEEDKKTRNDHFRDMIHQAKERNLKPKAVVFDTWYSGLDNLKKVRNSGFHWVTGLRKNRVVNGKKRLEEIEISEEGQIVFLRGYGTIRVFKFVSTNRRIDYFATSMLNISREQMSHFMETRWTVEVYHRELKQNNGISRCQAHTCRAQRNHIFLAISAWLFLFLRKRSLYVSFYQLKWEIVRDAVAHALAIRLQIS
jgi:putative transposase